MNLNSFVLQVDHVERAKRKEEIPLLKQDFEKYKEEDKVRAQSHLTRELVFIPLCLPAGLVDPEGG